MATFLYWLFIHLKQPVEGALNFLRCVQVHCLPESFSLSNTCCSAHYVSVVWHRHIYRQWSQTKCVIFIFITAAVLRQTVYRSHCTFHPTEITAATV